MTLWRNDSLETMGFSVSTGSEEMPSTWLLISFSARAPSASSNSWAVTPQAPSLATE